MAIKLNAEQIATVQAFQKAYQEHEKIVLYGTGINAEAIVKECSEYQILGLMDAAKTREEIWDLKVLTEEELLSLKVQKIVIVARPAVHAIIYKRIQDFVERHGIGVYDIYGNDVSQSRCRQVEDVAYFHIAYEDMWSQIQMHDTVSFDIFDTLLCRRTYQPHDVFVLMKSEDICKDFVQVRENAERALNCEVNIYEIYSYVQDICVLTDAETKELLAREIEKEKQVLCVRETMVTCLKQCIQMGKQVYLVSDMYMPKEILEEILEQNGITGYTELLISCEYGKSKESGLFDVLKSRIGISSCLHIGDNHQRDYVCAIQAGIDAFEVASPIKMMELSAYQTWLSYTDTIENRVLLGMLASRLFNSPFALYESVGKPCIDMCYDLGYIYIAPLVVAFVSWLINMVSDKKNAIVLFAARDGYLFRKVYQMLKTKLRLPYLPEDRYFLISRRAIAEIHEALDDEGQKRAYMDYIKDTGILDKETIYFVDFMSKGTCQIGLEKLIGRSLHGIYVQRSLGNHALRELSVEAFYKETSAMQKDRRIFAMCDFLECIFTSFSPSLRGFSKNREPVYEEETRTSRQLEIVDKLHSSIIDFVNDFYDIFATLAMGFVEADFCDEILRGTQSEFARMHLPDVENIYLDDAYGVCKNTGVDIFQ